MSKNVRRITYTAIAAAIIFVVTRLIGFPYGSGGYLNFGDASIYFSAYLLGGPIAAIAAAIGSALSDIMLGYIVYAPATFIIKGLMGLTVGYLAGKKSFWIYALACTIGGVILIVGYALFETAAFGFAVALANAPGNLIQWGGTFVAALLLYPVAKRIQRVIHIDALQR